MTKLLSFSIHILSSESFQDYAIGEFHCNAGFVNPVVYRIFTKAIAKAGRSTKIRPNEVMTWLT